MHATHERRIAAIDKPTKNFFLYHEYKAFVRKVYIKNETEVSHLFKNFYCVVIKFLNF